MKRRLFTLLGLSSIFLFNCSIDIEHEEDEFIKRIAGEWEIYSIRFSNQNGERITWCDETTESKFTYDPVDESGNYSGSVYFWTEALESCNDVEEFRGDWVWESSSGYGEDGISSMEIKITIKGQSTGVNYTNIFKVEYGVEIDEGISTELLFLTFKNENEEKTRFYEFKKIK